MTSVEIDKVSLNVRTDIVREEKVNDFEACQLVAESNQVGET